MNPPDIETHGTISSCAYSRDFTVFNDLLNHKLSIYFLLVIQFRVLQQQVVRYLYTWAQDGEDYRRVQTRLLQIWKV